MIRFAFQIAFAVAFSAPLSLQFACSSQPGTTVPSPPTDASTDAVTDAPTDASRCSTPLPRGCVEPVPSYANDIVPIFSRSCFRCHGVGGPQHESRDLTNYNSVFALRSAILNQVYACKMPPQDGPILADEDRATLMLWLVCEAPDN